MQTVKVVALSSVITAFVVSALSSNVVEAVKAVQDVLVTNTAAQPVPVTGSVSVAGAVSVANLPATQQVSGTVSVANFPDPGAPPAATKTFSIPTQSLLAGDTYTFGGVFTTASLLTVVTSGMIEVTFNGPAPVALFAESSVTLPLTQRIQVDSVTVKCNGPTSSSSCFFRFSVVGD